MGANLISKVPHTSLCAPFRSDPSSAMETGKKED
jgi:hypothetical protein